MKRKMIADAEFYAETYPDVKETLTVTSLVAGATLVSSYEIWGAAAKTYRVEEYSNGIVNGADICQRAECQDFRAVMRSARIL